MTHPDERSLPAGRTLATIGAPDPEGGDIETCRSCKAFLQPTWDRCKICGAPRAADAAGAADPDRRILVGGVIGLLVVVLLGVAFTAWRSSDDDDPVVSLPSTSASDSTAPSTTAAVPPEGAVAGPAESGEVGRPSRDDLGALCAGTLPGVTPAGDYPGTLGAPHVLTVAVPTGGDNVSIGDEALDSAWLDYWDANEGRPVELVFCHSIERGPAIADCGSYEGTPVRIQDAAWQIEIRAAATGEVLATTTLPGVTDCPVQVFVRADQTDILTTRKPDPNSVRAFAEPWVMN